MSRDTAARQLTMVPNWYGPIFQKDRESVRRLVETYRYLRREGVVGRWSHMMHPLVKGDTDYYYDQRTSRDRKKACIICKHKPEANSTVYPQGLLSDYNYTVGLESVKETTVRTGADLMSNGIASRDRTHRRRDIPGPAIRPRPRVTTPAPQLLPDEF